MRVRLACVYEIEKIYDREAALLEHFQYYTISKLAPDGAIEDIEVACTLKEALRRAEVLIDGTEDGEDFPCSSRLVS